MTAPPAVMQVNFAIFQAQNTSAPSPSTPDLRCVIAGTVNGVSAGHCAGTSPFTFTAATCDGVADDVTAFNSFNSAANTWQTSNPGLLIELDAQSGKTCEFIGGDVNSNNIARGLKRFQSIGYGASLGDLNGTGGGFALGGGSLAGVTFNGTASTARVATVSAGATSITLLDTSKCSLWSAGDWALIAGIDPQGFGDPPNPPLYQYVQVASVAACAGSGIITLSQSLTHAYKSTWPSYNVGSPGNSDLGGPGTFYQLTSQWDTTQAWYGWSVNQAGAQTQANGRDITLVDMSCPSSFCVIPSQNKFWRAFNFNSPGTNVTIEVDKIVENLFITNSYYRRVIFQSSGPNFTCTACTIGPVGITGTPTTTIITNSNISDWSLGSSSYGASGAVAVTNTVISSLETGGETISAIDTKGVWSSAGLTIPANFHITSASSGPGGIIRLTVDSSAGWSNGMTAEADGISGAGCPNPLVNIQVINPTTIDLPGTTWTTTCSGAVGNLPFRIGVPGANVYFIAGGVSHGITTGPILQIADLAVVANNATLISFTQNGSPYTGGLPTMAGGTPVGIAAHPAPSWSCTGCTGPLNVTDITGVPVGPYGSQATRVVTAANSGSAIYMPVFGPLSEVDMTVTAACSGASSLGFEQTAFTAVTGSTSYGGWDPKLNALVSSATPRVMTPTATSGAQSGDALTAPGAGTLLLLSQMLPFYSAVGNCASASTTVTVKTNQSVVYP